MRRLWKLRLTGGPVYPGDRCVSHIVNDVVDCALVAQSHRDNMVEANAGREGRLDGMAQHNVRMPEDRVDAQPPGLMAGHLAGYLVRCPSVHPWGAGVAGLVRRIIGDFRLIKIGAAAIAVPDRKSTRLNSSHLGISYAVFCL